MDDPKKKREKFLYLPEARNDYLIIGGARRLVGPVSMPEPKPAQEEPPGIYPCPCCGYLTFPVPKEEAIAYICPVCFWENDVFAPGESDPSDENHGLTLRQGRENFRRYGAAESRFVQYARPPLPGEIPLDL